MRAIDRASRLLLLRLLDDAGCTVRVHDPRTWSRVVRHGSTGLGLSYADGWWDTDDLVGFLRICTDRIRRRTRRLNGIVRAIAPAADRLAVALHREDRGADRADIHVHYDLSNEFFALLLDETMAYSCAYFTEPHMALAEAQTAKFDRLCTKLDLGERDHLLEIGTGWGAFAIHAAARHGCRVTTTTISEAQRSFAAKRVADAGLAERVQVLDLDYRDLTGRFDKLVSIEMIEAVDWREHARFLAACGNLLHDGGLMALQAIVIDDRAYARTKYRPDFIRTVVFPGSSLPSVASISSAVATRTDLSIVEVEDIGAHYPPTLAAWRENLNRDGGGALAALASRGEAPAGEPFRRLWEFYLAYCEAGFAERYISDVQVVLARPGGRAGGRAGAGAARQGGGRAGAGAARQGGGRAVGRSGARAATTPRPTPML